MSAARAARLAEFERDEHAARVAEDVERRYPTPRRCHSGPAARTCGFCADLSPTGPHQAVTPTRKD